VVERERKLVVETLILMGVHHGTDTLPHMNLDVPEK